MSKILITSILLLFFTNYSFCQDDKIKSAIEKYNDGDATGALVVLDSLIKSNPNDTLAIKYKYQICFYTDKEEQGFEAIKKIYPFTKACVNYGNLYFSNRSYTSAIFYYNKALEIDSSYVDAIFNRGLCKMYNYNTKEAVEDFELALKIKPDFMQVYNSLGNLYSSQFNYDKAIETYEKAIRIDSTYKETYYNKGLVQYKQNRYYDAKKSFDKALIIDGNFKEALYSRGLAKLRLDNQIMNNQIRENIQLSEVEGACDDLKKSYELGYEKAKRTILMECP